MGSFQNRTVVTVLHDPSRVLLGPHRGSTVPLVLDRQCSGRASRTSTSSPAELLLQLLIWFQSAFTTVQESSSCHKVVKYRSREARFSSPSCSTQNSRSFTLRLTENFDGTFLFWCRFWILLLTHQNFQTPDTFVLYSFLLRLVLGPTVFFLFFCFQNKIPD